MKKLALLALLASTAAQAQSYPSPTFNDVITATDVRFYGADPTGATDSTAAITAAVASGKNLFFPAGNFQFASMNLAGNQRVICAAVNQTLLKQNSTTGDFITMSGWFNSVEHCQLQPSTRVNGYQIVVAHSCFTCSLRDDWINNAFNGIYVQGGLTMSDILGGSMYGTTWVKYLGTSAARANNLRMFNVLVNNAYPLGYVTVPAGQPFVVTWAPSTAYTTGQITKVNSAIYQEATQSCTSAATGSGPSGLPSGTTPGSVWAGSIPDGTCSWRLASNDLIGLDWGNYAASVIAFEFVTLNNLESVRMTDVIGLPGDLTFDYPAFGTFVNLVGDHTFWDTFDGEGGGFVQLTDVYACSSLALHGIVTGGNFLGDLKVIGGRVCDNWGDGILLVAGSQFTIDGVTAGSNSQHGANLANNIEVGGGISDFSITNNKVGKDMGAGPAANNFAHGGVIVDTGASDYYVITGNTCSGFTQGACIADGGTGTHKTVSGNW